MGLYFNKQLIRFWQTIFPTTMGVSYRSAVQNPSLKSGTEGILENGESTKMDDVSCSMLAVTEGLGICWSECSWSHVNPTRYTVGNTEHVKQSTWCAACPGGPAPPSPALDGLVRYSARRYGFLQHCRAPCPPGGTWPGRPPGEHSTPAPGWTRSVCSARRCDTAGR